MKKKIQRLFEIDPWKIINHRFNPETMRLQESLTSLGNGHMGMRGNFEEGYSGDHLKGTYLAGIWYPDKTRVGWWKNGYPDYFGKVVNAVDFLKIAILINGVKVDLAEQTPSEFLLELDMKHGILRRRFTVEAAGALVQFTFERFVSLPVKELAVIRLKAKVLSGTADIALISALDLDVVNEESNYDQKFWEARDTSFIGEQGFLAGQLVENRYGVEQFFVTAAMENTSSLKKLAEATDQMAIAQRFGGQLKAGEECILEKRVAVVTSRDVAPEKQKEKAGEVLSALYGMPYQELRKAHQEAWEKRWHLADVKIEGDPASQQGIRYNLFQLFSTYYGEDERLNIGPKGFTGEKYGGATYWDTEAFALPLYLALASPDVGRNLLLYRYRQLPQAQLNAHVLGLDGALFPMVTFNGFESHNEWEIAFEEIHRNGAIAYAIYNYTNYTGDDSYLKAEGAEVLVEIARFWAARVHFSERAQKYMIHGVTGPNEYENNVNNNWYTNKLAQWVLQYTAGVCRKYQKELAVSVTESELLKWQEIAEKMYFPYDEKLGIFVQQDTFLDKKIEDVDQIPLQDRPLNQHWSWDRILRSCYIKQADVLQGIYFFNSQYSLAEKRRNFEFYEPLTVHESSLSPCVHAILAAELGKKALALELYQRTVRLDLDNYNNDTDDGLHITSMPGGWLAIVHGFAQMKTFDDALRFAPTIPDEWDSYRFHVNYRGRLIAVKVEKTGTLFDLISGEPLAMEVYGKKVALSDKLRVAMEDDQHV